MAKIALLGMRFYAYHGFYEEERKVGQYYVVDVEMETNFQAAAVSDNLENTINYETVYLICQREMRRKSKLLENVVERIGLSLRYNFSTIKELKIRLHKLNPPLGLPLEASMVETDANYSKKCGRCQRPMLCYSDKNCWCVGTKVHKKKLQNLRMQFGNNCLCSECLPLFA